LRGKPFRREIGREIASLPQRWQGAQTQCRPSSHCEEGFEPDEAASQLCLAQISEIAASRFALLAMTEAQSKTPGVSAGGSQFRV
jgi:hypothetical protein